VGRSHDNDSGAYLHTLCMHACMHMPIHLQHMQLIIASLDGDGPNTAVKDLDVDAVL